MELESVFVDGVPQSSPCDDTKGKVEEEIKASNVKDPEWRWPTHEKWYSMLEGVWKRRRITEGNSLQDGLQCPFEVTALIKERNEEFSEVTVKFHSSYLIAILRKYLPDVLENLCAEEPSIDVKDLFGIWDCLKDELKDAQSGCNCTEEAAQNESNGVTAQKEALLGNNPFADGNPEADSDGTGVANGVSDGVGKAYSLLHLRHLIRFLDEHFKDVSAKLLWIKQEGRVSYNMLWAFLTPGLEVRRLCDVSGQACHAVISEKGKYDHKSWAPDKNKFKIKLKVMDFNGESYRQCTMTYKIEEFDGEVPFTSLRVCPWSFFPSQEQQDMADHLEQRGQLFYNYAVKEPFLFMHFHGSLSIYERMANGCFQLRRVNADGRVMVDLLSLAKANPDWPLGNAQPPSELLRVVGEKETEAKERRQPTEEELRRAPAIVYGFSFSLKKWGCFDVGGLSEIIFKDQAYEQLVMKSVKQKEMLKSIVTTYLVGKGGRGRGVDVVAQKGEGCVVLCYGPPGTGKTLTAETLAETLHRPLWAISAFELGEEAGVLEECLTRVLSTALRWRAIVLLDEADGYLERRAFNVDVKRNLLTGVFLRLLEYYAGVLFLTTNRVGAFDQAFLSRISLCISYPALNDERRGLIWQALLARAGIAISEANINILLQCGQPLNGREIRNIISLAQTWANCSAQPPSFSHVHDALQLVLSGSKELLQDLESSTA